MSDHVRRALQGRSPWAPDAPLPRELKRAAHLIIDSDPHDIAAFRDARRGRLSALVSGLSEHERNWDSPTLPTIISADGKISTLALRRLAD